jgi:hypothetical protein
MEPLDESPLEDSETPGLWTSLHRKTEGREKTAHLIAGRPRADERGTRSGTEYSFDANALGRYRGDSL